MRAVCEQNLKRDFLLKIYVVCTGTCIPAGASTNTSPYFLYRYLHPLIIRDVNLLSNLSLMTLYSWRDIFTFTLYTAGWPPQLFSSSSYHSSAINFVVYKQT